MSNIWTDYLENLNNNNDSIIERFRKLLNKVNGDIIPNHQLFDEEERLQILAISMSMSIQLQTSIAILEKLNEIEHAIDCSAG